MALMFFHRQYEKLRHARPWAFRLIIVCALLLSTFWLADRLTPLHLPDNSAYSTVVLDENGDILRAFADSNGIWRQKIAFAEVGQNYIDALVNYEDRYFWWHPGINPLALLRATWQNLRCQCVVSGGSTLTMQVARRLHPHRKTLSGKLMQAFRALQLEWHLSKVEILNLYLNLAPFGGTLEGVAAASHAYFGRKADQLSDSEAALLAVLPQAPSRLRPDRHPQRAQRARDKILRRLQNFGVWPKERVAQARMETVWADTPAWPQTAPLFSRMARRSQPYQPQIRTTIRRDWQEVLQDFAQAYSARFGLRTSMAILVVDHHTHQVKAYVGSADWKSPHRLGHVDMVKAIRSPGSTLKPFIYGLAMDDGLIHAQSLLMDIPREASDYQPDNFHRGFQGPVSTTDALQKSLNLPAVQVLEALGPERFYHALSAAQLAPILPHQSRPNLSLALGGAGTSLWNLVALYSALGNQGKVKTLQWQIADKKSPSATVPNDHTPLLSPENAWIIYRTLADAPIPHSVAGSSLAQSENSIAWKTGTSYGFRDAWAIGSNANLTVGIWVGHPDGTPQSGRYGANTAAPALFHVFTALDYGSAAISKPKNVEKQTICWPLGRSLPSDHPHCHQAKSVWIGNGVIPPTLGAPKTVSFWQDKQSGLRISPDCRHNGAFKNTSINSVHAALWPADLEPWLPQHWQRYHQIPALHPICRSLSQAPGSTSSPLKIVGLASHSRVQSPRNSGQAPVVQLAAIGGEGKRWWYLNNRYRAETSPNAPLQLSMDRLGENTLVVIDEGGNQANWVVIRESE